MTRRRWFTVLWIIGAAVWLALVLSVLRADTPAPKRILLTPADAWVCAPNGRGEGRSCKPAAEVIAWLLSNAPDDCGH